ncbi:Atg7 protein [Martiniozyma asiatica (nom. inval.)]|nr:Atg7 protein [Martiniozyma asiatica]
MAIQSEPEYAASQSFLASSFFVKLSQLKLDVLKLSEHPVDLIGFYPLRSSSNQQPALNLNESSFDLISNNRDSMYSVPGKLLNTNSIDEFKAIDKKQLLRTWGGNMWQQIRDGTIWENLSQLGSFGILSFADLKKWKFYYWVATPQLGSQWTLLSTTQSDSNYVGKFENDSLFGVLSDNNQIEKFSINEAKKSGRILFNDLSTVPEKSANILRNFLTALAYNKIFDIEIYALKGNSITTIYKLRCIDSNFLGGCNNDFIPLMSGWERTSSNKLCPKLADLGSLINPIELADQATDLNLKLMKWRLVPSLDLDIVKNSKCLLLGSGTLGSYVARALLAWGVRNITFVDNGKVSFSNPVRQPLFDFEDCLNGGEPKAETCAKNLKRVFPNVNSVGISLEVPMMGHPPADEIRARDDYEKLVNLIREHDVIYLLMDSSEARWLPTVLGYSEDKIVINAALGFESYLVMRHGPSPLKPLTVDPKIGCYFCSSLSTPNNSLLDRSLDQMCTVTRPGVALMASSIAVELMVSILQTPDKNMTPHSTTERFNVLGSVPHQLRGFLHDWQLLKLHAEKFTYCPACSVPVVSAVKEKGWDFVKTVISNNQLLEEVCGLKKVKEEAEEVLKKMQEWGDDTDGEDFD